jgi:hypothetical protein
MHPNTFVLLAGHGAWEEEAAVDGHPLTKGYGHQIMLLSAMTHCASFHHG